MRRESMRRGKEQRIIKDSLFPVSLFAIYLGVLSLMSGIHQGLVVLINAFDWNEVVQTAIPIVYWGCVAVGLTCLRERR